MPRSSDGILLPLKCQFADNGCYRNALIECLGEAGCNDALVGIGQPGRQPN